jgi:pilus assembly protein CpaC
MTVLALSLVLAVTCLSARSQDTTAPSVILRSVDAQPAPDGSGTWVTFHGNNPLPYSLSPVEGGAWSMTMDGVDCREVSQEMSLGAVEMGRMVIRPVYGTQGRPATRVEFMTMEGSDRKIRLDGNDLMVQVTPGRPAATTSPAAAPSPAVVPAVATSTPSVVPARSSASSMAVTHASVGPNSSPAQDEGGSSDDLVVSSGKSMTLDLQSPVTRVSVSNPAIADAVVVSSQQLLINGLTHGSTSLVLWFKGGSSKSYNLTVQMDTAALERRMKEFFPDQNIEVGASKDTLVLYGSVSKPEIGEKAVKLASDYTGKVINNLTYPSDGRQQILLKIMFAEIDRDAMTELSASLVRFDPLNPRGDHEGLSTTGRPGASGNFADQPVGPNFNFGEAINIYGFSFRDKWSAFITALKSRGLAQVLAEPTLITADGQKASFLAGGEIPIPVAQAGAGFTSVTIEWKQFGISLAFTPTVRDKDTIVMRVNPEVSSLDFNNAIILGGFRIPALRVRRTDTEIELKENQSFAIAGLYSSELVQTKKKIPLLGDIPGLGYLFQSKNLQKAKTELLVVATPMFVRPNAPGQAPQPPKFDQSFDLDKPKKQSKLETPAPVAEPKTNAPMAAK